VTVGSRQAPHAAFDVEQKPGIAQHLKLLANLVADMAIVGMQLLQLARERIRVIRRELLCPNGARH
jgi:hypothetical protein